MPSSAGSTRPGSTSSTRASITGSAIRSAASITPSCRSSSRRCRRTPSPNGSTRRRNRRATTTPPPSASLARRPPPQPHSKSREEGQIMATGPSTHAHDHPADHGAHGHDEHGHYPGFFTRWFCSTNHKDICTLYIIFAIIAGLIGGAFSGIIRAQLMHPTGGGIQDHHLYNVIATAHGLILIFVMRMSA